MRATASEPSERAAAWRERIGRLAGDDATDLSAAERFVLARLGGLDGSPAADEAAVSRELRERWPALRRAVSAIEKAAGEKVRRGLGLSRFDLDSDYRAVLAEYLGERPEASYGEARGHLRSAFGMAPQAVEVRRWAIEVGLGTDRRRALALTGGADPEEFVRVGREPRTGLPERAQEMLARALGVDRSPHGGRLRPASYGELAREFATTVSEGARVVAGSAAVVRWRMSGADPAQDPRRHSDAAAEASPKPLDEGQIADLTAVVKEPASGVSALERYVLARRFGMDGREPASFQEVADELSVPLRVARAALRRGSSAAGVRVRGGRRLPMDASPPLDGDEVYGMKAQASEEARALASRRGVPNPLEDDAAAEGLMRFFRENPGATWNQARDHVKRQTGLPVDVAAIRSYLQERGLLTEPPALRGFGIEEVRRAIDGPDNPASLSGFERAVLAGRLGGADGARATLADLAREHGAPLPLLTWAERRAEWEVRRHLLGLPTGPQPPVNWPSSAAEGSALNPEDAERLLRFFRENPGASSREAVEQAERETGQYLSREAIRLYLLRLGSVTSPAALRGFGIGEIRRAIDGPDNPAGLPDVERAVLANRLGGADDARATLADLAREHGFSEQWVSWVERRAARKVRRHLLGLPPESRFRGDAPRKPALSDEAAEDLMRFFRQNPEAPLPEAIAFVEREAGQHVSPQTVRNYLHRFGSVTSPAALRGFEAEAIRRALSDPSNPAALSDLERAVLAERLLGGSDGPRTTHADLAREHGISLPTVARAERAAALKVRGHLLGLPPERRTPTLLGTAAWALLPAIIAPDSGLSDRERYVLATHVTSGQGPDGGERKATAAGMADALSLSEGALRRLTRLAVDKARLHLTASFSCPVPSASLLAEAGRWNEIFVRRGIPPEPSNGATVFTAGDREVLTRAVRWAGPEGFRDAGLGERERAVLGARHRLTTQGSGDLPRKVLREIADELGVSRAGAALIEERAAAKLLLWIVSSADALPDPRLPEGPVEPRWVRYLKRVLDGQPPRSSGPAGGPG